MMLHIEHPPILLAAAMILSLLFALYIYHKDVRFKTTKRIIKVFLIFLRFTSLCTLILLLFKPKWVDITKKVEKPIIVTLQDASSSILKTDDSLYYLNEFISDIKQNNKNLSESYELYTYNFSDSIKEGLSTKYHGVQTDISNALNNINDRFHNRNLAGLVLATDGLYNLGSNPVYTIQELNVPIYSLALGDTSKKTDISIESVRHNELAYYKNKFPISFEVYSNFDSENQHEIKIVNNNNVVFSELVSLNETIPLTREIFIDATHEGIQYFDISVSPHKTEKNKRNNQKRIAVEVLNNKQEILVLYATPHPDIAALKSALEDGGQYSVTTSLYKKFNEEIEAYNLIILHQIPGSTSKINDQLSSILSSNISTLFIGGDATDWKAFNRSQNLVNIKHNNTMHDVFATLNENFSPFKFSEKCIDFIYDAPPLKAPFGDVNRVRINHTLLTQKINNIQTNKGLLLFAEEEEKHIAFLLAEGLWKWRLYDYKKNKSHANFNEIVQGLCHYLTINKDKRKLRIQYPKIIQQGNTFTINAQVYNDTYQLIDDADVKLILKDESGSEYVYSFHPDGTTFTKDLKSLDVGTYEITVKSKYKGIETERSGTLAVLKTQIENQQIQAAWDLLQKISDQSNGLMIQKNNFKNYHELIFNRSDAQPEIYYNKQLSDIIKQKTIFLVLLLCFLLEWGIRKSMGTH